jgi:hypothetical protein
MVRLLLGLIKGALIGGALGFGAQRLGLTGAWGYVLYGVVGGAVGLLVGRPFWSHLVDSQSTIWTAMLKAIFGFGVGAGLYALARHVAPDPELALMGETHRLSDWPFLLGAAIGALYGAWVELDDPPKSGKAAKAAKPDGKAAAKG